MTVKYSPLLQSDPESGLDESALKFGSIHTFNTPQANDRKFKSIFTYTGLNPNHGIHHVDNTKQSLPFRICSGFVTFICYILWFITLPVSGWWTFKMISNFERLVVFRLGKLKEAKGPGLVIILPCIDKVSRVDLRMRAFSVPPQNLLTADGGGVEVGAEVFFRVKDPILCVTNVQDMNRSSRVIAQTALARFITSRDLSDLEMHKLEICDQVQTEINKMTLTWGVEVSKVQLSEVKVLQEPNTIMSGCNNPFNILSQVLFPPGSSAPSSVMSGGFPFPNQTPPPPPPLSQAPAILPMSSTQPIDAADVKLMKCQTVEELIENVRPHLTPDLVKDIGCVYRFVEEGTVEVDKRVFYMDLKHGNGDIGEGEPPYGDWDVTLTLSIDLLTQLLRQELSPFAAYMRGDLTVDGDLRAASQLGQLAEMINK